MITTHNPSPLPHGKSTYHTCRQITGDLINARGGIVTLQSLLPDQHSQLAALYNQLAQIQGKIESIINLIPTSTLLP